MRDWWNYNNSRLVIDFLVIVAVVAIILFGGMGLSETRCAAKTENIGFAHRWSYLGGCQIEVIVGRWIPLENYHFEQK